MSMGSIYLDRVIIARPRAAGVKQYGINVYADRGDDVYVELSHQALDVPRRAADLLRRAARWAGGDPGGDCGRVRELLSVAKQQGGLEINGHWFKWPEEL